MASVKSVSEARPVAGATAVPWALSAIYRPSEDCGLYTPFYASAARARTRVRASLLVEALPLVCSRHRFEFDDEGEILLEVLDQLVVGRDELALLPLSQGDVNAVVDTNALLRRDVDGTRSQGHGGVELRRS